MYLVMTQKKATNEQKEYIQSQLNLRPVTFNYDGESKQTIKERLIQEGDNSVLITADSRLLSLVHRIIPPENVRIYFEETGEIKTLQESTNRILRIGHNLMHLFDAGEFKLV